MKKSTAIGLICLPIFLVAFISVVAGLNAKEDDEERQEITAPLNQVFLFGDLQIKATDYEIEQESANSDCEVKVYLTIKNTGNNSTEVTDYVFKLIYDGQYNYLRHGSWGEFNTTFIPLSEETFILRYTVPSEVATSQKSLVVNLKYNSTKKKDYANITLR